MPENSNNDVECTSWHCGIRTTAGGTRTEVKLDRPWQVELRTDPQGCPFCIKRGNEPSVIPTHASWRVLKNSYTPFPFHLLVIPDKCWPTERVRTLGGEDNIRTALRIVKQLIEQRKDDLLTLVHVGYLAGQNVPHLHWHLHSLNETPQQEKFDDEIRANTKLWCNAPGWGLSITAGGIRAGQLFVAPHEPLPRVGENLASDLASALHFIVEKYAEKFRSVQGLPPDFAIGLRFKGDRFYYGSYVPILNHWGAGGYMDLLEQSPVTLPWPHEETVKYLLS